MKKRLSGKGFLNRIVVENQEVKNLIKFCYTTTLWHEVQRFSYSGSVIVDRDIGVVLEYLIVF